MKWSKYVVLLSFILFLLVGCNASIRRLNKKIPRKDGKTVRIKGKVINSLQLNDLNLFTIKRRKQTINVVTPNYLPIRGEKIRVTGVVNNEFKYSRYPVMVVVIEDSIVHRSTPDSTYFVQQESRHFKFIYYNKKEKKYKLKEKRF